MYLFGYKYSSQSLNILGKMIRYCYAIVSYILEVERPQNIENIVCSLERKKLF